MAWVVEQLNAGAKGLSFIEILPLYQLIYLIHMAVNIFI